MPPILRVGGYLHGTNLLGRQLRVLKENHKLATKRQLGADEQSAVHQLNPNKFANYFSWSCLVKLLENPKRDPDAEILLRPVDVKPVEAQQIETRRLDR